MWIVFIGIIFLLFISYLFAVSHTGRLYKYGSWADEDLFSLTSEELEKWGENNLAELLEYAEFKRRTDTVKRNYKKWDRLYGMAYYALYGEKP